jgi:hypothetical protein
MGSRRCASPPHAAARSKRRSALPMRRAAPVLLALLVITQRGLSASPAAPQPSRKGPSPAPKGALTLPAKPASGTSAQVAVLLDIKRVLDPRGKALTDWKAGSPNPCKWTGVGCDSSRRVTDINFWDQDRQKPFVKLAGGKLPSGALLRRLPRLATIDVGSTGVGGPLPGDWSQLGLLEILNLDTNALTGAAMAPPLACCLLWWGGAPQLPWCIPAMLGSCSSCAHQSCSTAHYSEQHAAVALTACPRQAVVRVVLRMSGVTLTPGVCWVLCAGVPPQVRCRPPGEP